MGLRQRHSVGVVLLVLFIGLGAACSKSSSSTASDAGPPVPCTGVGSKSLPKTKFVLHMGLAFGAFHRYIYKPYKAGSFQSGAPRRIRTFLKAAGSAAVVVHELRIAKADAEADPTLCKLVAPLDSLDSKLGELTGRLKGNPTDPAAAIESANGAVDGVQQQATQLGAVITDR